MARARSPTAAGATPSPWRAAIALAASPTRVASRASASTPMAAPPRHLDERLGQVLVGEAEAHATGGLQALHGGRGEGHHLVGEVDGRLGGLGVAEDADGLLHHLLRVGLAHVDDVVDVVPAPKVAPAGRSAGSAEVRSSSRPSALYRTSAPDRPAASGRRPVAEVVERAVGVAQEAELPELVGDVLAGVVTMPLERHQDLVGVASATRGRVGDAT